MLKVSIITPTEDRAHFLKSAYALIKRQNYSNWEWLIYDTSLHPSIFNDSRVRYRYDSSEIVSIGEKRNRLIAESTGDVIVHFDDDDYYAPTYLDTVVQALKKAPFFNFHSWFSHDMKTKQTYYWLTDETSSFHYILNGVSGPRVREIDLSPLGKLKENLNKTAKRGYGFSFAYIKEVARMCPFPDLDLSEDWHFFDTVEAKGFEIGGISDERGEVVHVIHENNTSTEYPQYRIPHFLVRPLLPGFFAHMQEMHP